VVSTYLHKYNHPNSAGSLVAVAVRVNRSNGPTTTPVSRVVDCPCYSATSANRASERQSWSRVILLGCVYKTAEMTKPTIQHLCRRTLASDAGATNRLCVRIVVRFPTQCTPFSCFMKQSIYPTKLSIVEICLGTQRSLHVPANVGPSDDFPWRAQLTKPCRLGV
jgi:hypothetical protein